MALGQSLDVVWQSLGFIWTVDDIAWIAMDISWVIGRHLDSHWLLKVEVSLERLQYYRQDDSTFDMDYKLRLWGKGMLPPHRLLNLLAHHKGNSPHPALGGLRPDAE